MHANTTNYDWAGSRNRHIHACVFSEGNAIALVAFRNDVGREHCMHINCMHCENNTFFVCVFSCSANARVLHTNSIIIISSTRRARIQQARNILCGHYHCIRWGQFHPNISIHPSQHTTTTKQKNTESLQHRVSKCFHAKLPRLTRPLPTCHPHPTHTHTPKKKPSTFISHPRCVIHVVCTLS